MAEDSTCPAAPISINNNVLEASTEAVQAFGINTETAKDSHYILVQAKRYLGKEDKQALEDAGVEIKELVSDKTYLCRYEPADLQAIRDAGDFVVWVGVYGDQFCIEKSLKAKLGQSGFAGTPQVPLSGGTVEVDVVFHQDHKQKANSLVESVARAAHIDGTTLEGRKNQIRIQVQPRYLRDVAKIDEVQSILRVEAVKPYNNIGRNILMGHSANVDLHDLSFGGTILRGQNQIVAVADTGIDSKHHAFSGRIHAEYAWGRPQGPDAPAKTDDPHGHGTHVSGSVLGDGDYLAGNSIIRVKGTAPEARLVMQSLLTTQGGFYTVPDLDLLFRQAYQVGARIHNNSWGAVTPALPYLDGTHAYQIDKFVSEHPDMVICFAAGNDGIDRNASDGRVDARQIGSQGAAKNCITVGASESQRDWQLTYGGFTDDFLQPVFTKEPLQSDPVANNIAGMAAFSNRGPTPEHRLKPDVVAPGTCILSARSSRATDSQSWGQSEDARWKYNGGTSMACPLVAGGCAVLRQALLPQYTAAERALARPSAAVLKALIVNGAVTLQGQYTPTEAGPSPNPDSGWGLVNLARSVRMARRPGPGAQAGWYDGDALRDGGRYQRTINIVDSGKTLKITLVWTDPPGRLLQNKLELRVRTTQGMVAANAGIHPENNVEQIVWPGIATGNADVEVKPVWLTSKQQAFALAWEVF